MSENLVTKAIDWLAKIVLVGAVGLVAVAVFSVLVVALNWLVIPILVIIAAIWWGIHRGWFDK